MLKATETSCRRGFVAHYLPRQRRPTDPSSGLKQAKRAQKLTMRHK